MLTAAAYLPVDEELIPTGVVKPVGGTAFDFQRARTIRLEQEGEQVPYDHNFCLAAARGPLKQAAWAQGSSSGVEMEVWTTEPGVQFYAGAKVAPPVPGHGGRIYKPYSGFCRTAGLAGFAEPAVFPQAVLWPGEVYRQVTEYRFSTTYAAKAARSVSYGASAPRTCTTAAATAWAFLAASTGERPTSRAAR